MRPGDVEHAESGDRPARDRPKEAVEGSEGFRAEEGVEAARRVYGAMGRQDGRTKPRVHRSRG